MIQKRKLFISLLLVSSEPVSIESEELVFICPNNQMLILMQQRIEKKFVFKISNTVYQIHCLQVFSDAIVASSVSP